ncbi:MAG: DNA polymerase/3'-5' exonuclease PolX [Elusimicrobia bacterium]|nr:DNA polymerase/3'-5' exonuclease PolX [Elusimicrobiota bacterium]
MITNAKLSEIFDEMAVLLTFDDGNPFRIRAYQKAGQIIGGLPREAGDLSGEDLARIEGIGKGIASHISEILKTGTLQELQALRRKVPEGLLALARVPGMGPKRARRLYYDEKIHGLEQLQKAAEAGRLRDLSGFGAKLEENILKGIRLAVKASERKLYWEAKLLAQKLLKDLRACPGVAEVVPAGSLRRGAETVGDLDILCAARDGARAVEFFTRMPGVERVLAAGATKAAVWLKDQIQCDFRVVPPESFGAALQYFTGSKEHNVVLRELAVKQGYSLNEYGLFKSGDSGHKKPLAGRTEEEIYRRLGLAWIAPELRECRGEIAAAQRGSLPDLVELKDVRGDFHNHTRYTDGRDSLEDMVLGARSQGWEWTAIGDHSQSLKVAHGLSPRRLQETIEELRGLQKKHKDIRLMRSMEVDILKGGALDYPDEVLKTIDVVIGSVHTAFTLPEEEMTRRIEKAAANPHMDILGHLSGRLIGRREAYAVDAGKVFAQAARMRTAVEINGQPQRQDLSDTAARMAAEGGVTLAVTTDAHSAAQLEYMEAAVTIARRAGLEKKHILNCLTYDELKRWLERHG